MIDTHETLAQFGFDPSVRKPKHREYIVSRCDRCGSTAKMLYRVYLQKTSPYCKHCPEYKSIRSEIAKTSNRTRPSTSKNLQQYMEFLQPLRDGTTTFMAVSKQLGVDDSTVCKFYHKHFDVRSNAGGKSCEESEVLYILSNILGSVDTQVRYPNSRNRADFFCESIGYIEYDGSGFWHIGKEVSDSKIDATHSPLRLSAQILFGKESYLQWLLQMPNASGYCSVASHNIARMYSVRVVEKTSIAARMLTQCHALGNCAGTKVFGLFYGELLIGVAKFGNSTNPHDTNCLELRRFFVLDGTPKNTESWFLRQCEKRLSGRLVTYIHSHEKGSYLKALGWTQLPIKQKEYDCYKIGCKIYSKRVVWGWAKRKGLVDKFGTTLAKEILVAALGGVKITEPSKIKFEKILGTK